MVEVKVEITDRRDNAVAVLCGISFSVFIGICAPLGAGSMQPGPAGIWQ
jgi:hypothetical protein